MKSKAAIIAFLVSFVTVILLVLTSFVPLLEKIREPVSLRIYEQLGEAKYLRKYMDTPLAPETDQALGDLEYADTLCGVFSYGEGKYQVYMYQFNDTETAKTYISKAADVHGDFDHVAKLSEGRRWLLKQVGTFFGFYGNCAYCVYGETKILEFVNMISEDFSISLMEVRLP